MQVIPALLNNTFEEFITQFNSLQKYYRRFSIDIIDGEYANNKTIQIKELVEIIKQKKVTIEKNTIFDFDLMVVDYERYIKDLESITDIIPIANVFIHDSALKDSPLPNSNKISIGLSIDPQGRIDVLEQKYNLKRISAIQIMTIIPGFQGQSFKPELLDKIDQLRGIGYRSPIFIDGSVNDHTIPIIKGRSNPPDYLCIGSYLTKAGDELPARVKRLEELLK